MAPSTLRMRRRAANESRSWARPILDLAISPPKKRNSAPKMDSQEAKMTKAVERVLDRVCCT